jgi:apolipoprotein N-acyltransferase
MNDQRSMCAVAGWSLAAGLLFCMPFSQMGWWWSIPALACHAMVASGSMRWWKRLAAGWIGWLPCWVILEGWLHQVTTAGCIVLIAYMALWSALVPVMAARLRTSLSERAAWLGFPLALVSIEWARSRPIWDGYAWFQSGHAWIDATLPAQAADLLGVGLVSLTVAMLGEALACAWSRRGMDESAVARSWRAPAALAIALVSVATAWGAYRLATTPIAPRVRIVAVQTDVLTSNKIRWTPEQQVKDMQQALDLSARAIIDLRSTAGAGPELPTMIVWPETSVPGFGLDPATVETVVRVQAWPGDRFVEPILDLSRVAGPILVGSPAFDGLREAGNRWAWDRQFNAAYLIDDGAVMDRYDKAYLTPFGERMPYISAWDWLEDQLLALGAAGMSFDMQAGDRPRNMAWPGTELRVATPICFEDTVSHVVRRMVRDPSAAACIVNLSNDGWFGTSDAGRRHHELMARWRCIECRLPMVRVANTGESSWIDSCGRVVERLAPQSAGTLMATPQLDGRDTLVMAAGDILPAMSLVLMCVLAVPVQRRWLGLAVAIVLISLAGCSGGAEESSAVSGAWSTRSLSVTPDPAMPSTVQAAQPAFTAPEGTSVRDAALVILTSACTAEYPQFRANAVEALVLDQATLTKQVGALLADPNPAVRFSACMAVGRARLALFAPAVKPLLQDQNLAVRAGAIFALQRLGQHPDQSPLAGMSGAKDLTIRGIAIFVLGELGNTSAVPVLRDALQRPTDNTNPMRARIVDLQTAEALAKLGDRSQLDPVRAALLAPGEQAELMCLGAQILGNVKDQSSEAMLLGIVAARGRTERPAEVRLLAGEAAIKMGSARTPEILAMARMLLTSRMPMVRAQAATTLGTGGLPADVASIAPLLRDPNALVQLSAAQAILRCTPQDSTSGTVATD